MPERRLEYTWKEYNVMDFGAIGDGSADDRNAFQDCFNAAIVFRGKVIIPCPDNYYKIGSTIDVLPGESNQVHVDVEGWGWGNTGPAPIHYTGANRTKVFNIVGLKKSVWQGIHVGIESGRSEIIVFDIDTTASASSSTYVTWKNCHVNVTGNYSVGWRTAHKAGGNGDVSNHQWENCVVYGTDSLGQIGYLNEGANCLSMTWCGGFTAHVQNIYSNLSGTHYQAGDEATNDRGNGSVWFFGMGASGNDCDYVFAREQCYTIIGGRYESGGYFLSTGNAGSHNAAISVMNVEIDDYTAAYAFDLNTAASLVIDNCRVNRTGTPIMTDLVLLNNGGGIGSLSIRGGSCRVTNLYNHEGGDWKVYAQGVGKGNAPDNIVIESFHADHNGTVLS